MKAQIRLGRIFGVEVGLHYSWFFIAALITFGIPPTYPATGYGYIHRGPETARRQDVPAYRVRSFREKPVSP